MRLLIINGPSLNMLGIREPEMYGTRTYAQLEEYIKEACAENGAECEIFQSNYEGAIVEKIQSALNSFDGIIINAAAYTHTSIAILDALRAVALPAAEVHLTDIDAREEFRRISYPALYCSKSFRGKGFESYKEAVCYLTKQRV